MRVMQATLHSLARRPFKSSVTLATAGLGVAVLIIALSTGAAVARLVSERLEGDGLVAAVAVSGRFGGTPDANEVRRQVTATLLSDVSGVAAVSSVDGVPFRSFVIGGRHYEVRSVLSVSETYLNVMDLDLIAGTGFVPGSRDALISASLAELLFGSPIAALGQPLRTAVPRVDIRGEVSTLLTDIFDELFAPVYTVRGIYADPDDLRRRAYGIADMLVPVRTFSGADRRSHQTHFRFVLRAAARSLATVESQVRVALALRYGEELSVEAWEGQPFIGGPLAELRSVVKTFSFTASLLGVLLLIIGCVGIFSLMTVEILSRSRQIAMSRAFGASRGTIIREFLARSLIIMVTASMLGVVFSLILSAPLTDLVTPIFNFDFAADDRFEPVITPTAVAAGVAAAVGTGGLLGTLPVFHVLATPIAEAIRG